MTQIIDFTINHFWIVSGVAIVAYIIAYVFSKRTECVVLYKWYDYWALILFAVSPLIALLVGLFVGPDGESEKAFLSITCKVLMSLSVVVLFITSIIANLGHGWTSLLYIFVSLIAKIPFILGSFIVALSLMSVFDAGSQSKDGRFRDGTKGNQKIRALGVFFAVFTPLLFTLIKPEEYQDKVIGRLRGKVSQH